MTPPPRIYTFVSRDRILAARFSLIIGEDRAKRRKIAESPGTGGSGQRPEKIRKSRGNFSKRENGRRRGGGQRGFGRFVFTLKGSRRRSERASSRETRGKALKRRGTGGEDATWRENRRLRGNAEF